MRLTEAWNGSFARSAHYMHNLEEGQPNPPGHFTSMLQLTVQDLSSGTTEEYLIELDRFNEDLELFPVDTITISSLGVLISVLNRWNLEINKPYWLPDSDETYLEYRERKELRYRKLAEQQ